MLSDFPERGPSKHKFIVCDHLLNPSDRLLLCRSSGFGLVLSNVFNPVCLNYSSQKSIIIQLDQCSSLFFWIWHF